MQDGVLAKKLDLTFGRLDSSGEGQLTADDMVAVGDRLGAAFGREPADATVVSLKDTLMSIWETDLAPMDTNANGWLDATEFNAAMRKAIDTDLDGFNTRFGAMAEAWMKVADTNGDGTLSLDEYIAMHSATHRVSADDLAQAFSKLDRDGSGALDMEEVSAAALEYYTSDDPDAPGNQLYGPL